MDDIYMYVAITLFVAADHDLENKRPFFFKPMNG